MNNLLKINQWLVDKENTTSNKQSKDWYTWFSAIPVWGFEILVSVLLVDITVKELTWLN